MLTGPQPLNNMLQTSNVSPAPLPLAQPTNAAVPITIETRADISDVYDSLFASQVSGSTPLLKSIRSILIKKFLLDHAAQQLLFQPILTFDDLIAFTLDILHRTTLLP